MSRLRFTAETTRRHRAAFAVAGCLALAAIVALVFVLRVADRPTGFQLFIGRLHPLIVHLPIGFILLALILEGLSRVRRFVRVRHAVGPALVLCAMSALSAVVAGFLLAASGGYSGELVSWHMWLGIGVAAGTMVAAGLHYAASVRRTRWLGTAYRTALAGTVSLVMLAGHLGGTLSRGPDYLTEYMPAPMLAIVGMLTPQGAAARPSFTYPDEAVIYTHLVAPVLQDRCVSCHGTDRQSGGLRLHTREAILAGGTSGPVLMPGRAAESRLVQRIWLPHDHEDVMPPRGRQPLSVVQAELLRWWIDQGASFDQTMANKEPPAGVQAMVEQIAGRPEERIAPVLRTGVPEPDPDAVERARALGVALLPVSQGSNFLQASCVTAPTSCGSEELRALVPLAEQLAALDFGGTPITDADLETVGRFRNLVRLRLERTAIGDAGLAHLVGLQHLEYLNLYGTAVSDRGLASLEPLSSLRSLYLWQTAVTADGAQHFGELLPRVRIDLGIEPHEVVATSPIPAEANSGTY